MVVVASLLGRRPKRWGGGCRLSKLLAWRRSDEEVAADSLGFQILQTDPRFKSGDLDVAYPLLGNQNSFQKWSARESEQNHGCFKRVSAITNEVLSKQPAKMAVHFPTAPGFKQVPKHKVRILNQPQERAGPCEGRPEQKLPKDTWSCRFLSSLDD